MPNDIVLTKFVSVLSTAPIIDALREIRVCRYSTAIAHQYSACKNKKETVISQRVQATGIRSNGANEQNSTEDEDEEKPWKNQNCFIMFHACR